MYRRRREDIRRPIVLIFGLTGAGKNSVINMLKGSPVGPAFDDVNLCNLYHRILYRDGKTYIFWNTPDLDSTDAVRDLRVFVDEYTADLLIYCIEDGPVDVTCFNYDLVWQGLCKRKVPIMLVVMGLKGKPDGDVWWHENKKKIEAMKMSFDGHVCIPSWRNMDDKEYTESAEKLWSLVRAHFGPKHNVILFGESGAGKSSVVNMIVGKAVAKVSSALRGCTFKNDAYEAIIGDKRYVIYDTAGLNEGEQGRTHWEAIKELYTLIRELDGVSLLVYCMRGRVRENAETNWNLFNKVICGGKVPIIAIVTGLEAFEDPDDFLKDENNWDLFKMKGMEPRDVGCVVSIFGERNQYADTYAKSQFKVRNFVTRHCLQKPWSEEKEKWFAAEVYESGLGFATRKRLDYSTQMRDALDEFIQETRMKQDDTEKLRATLLKAEKRYRKRLLL